MCPTEFPANLVWQPASSRTGSSKWWRFGGLFWSQSVYMSQNKTNWCCPEAFKVHRTPQNVLFRKSDEVEDVKVFQFLMIKTCDKLPIVSQHHVRLEKKDGDGITAQIWANSSCSAAEPGLPSSSISIPTSSRMDSAKKFWSQNLALDRVPFGVETCRNIMEKQKDNKRWLEMNHSS